MKSNNYPRNIKQIFLLVAIAIIINISLIQEITTLKNKRSLLNSEEESFLEENSQNQELEYAVPTNNSTNTAKMSAEGWLKISSTEFQNLVKFPPIEINGNKFNVEVDRRNFRINTLFNQKKEQEKDPKRTNLDFYFRLVNNLIYYTINKKDVNMLGSIDIVSVKEKTFFLPGQESDSLCFQVKDHENNEWDLCAEDKKTASNFICKIRTSLGESCDVNSNNSSKGNNNINKTKIETETYQPIIVVPIPAKECNNNWDYNLKGNDWECGCQEGIEQSPIDIPEIENIIESPVTPYFTFNTILAKNPVRSIDGELKTKENLKVQYYKNAIRVFHNNIGKIVTLDGSVYIGEEIVFHTPAEHKINGREMDMEMQIIYYGRSKGDIAKQVVLSFLFEQRPGIYNKFLEDLDIFNLPNDSQPEKDLQNNLYVPKVFYNVDDDSEIDMATKPFSFYTYQGSLTMPPCSEGTIHYVVSDPIPIGSVVIQLFKEALKKSNTSDNGILENNRKIQALNGRKVFFYDKDKYDTNTAIPQIKPSRVSVPGHYERIKREKTYYQWVNNSEPSKFPGAMLVPNKEVQRILNYGKNNKNE